MPDTRQHAYHAASQRSRTVPALAVVVIGALVGLTACDTGGAGPVRPSSSAGAALSRPSGSEDRLPAGSSTAAATRTPARTATRTGASTPSAAATTGSPAASAAARPTRPAASTPAPNETATAAAPSVAAVPPTPTAAASASPVAAPAGSGGPGPLVWALLVALAAALIGGVLIWRSRRKSAWDAGAAALAADTRGVTAARLPPLLTAETAVQRGLTWPALRSDLIEVSRRWETLAGRAPDEDRRAWCARVGGALRELVAAVDTENEALAGGRDWRLLRPRVNDAERGLTAVLAERPLPVPPAAGDYGPPAGQPA